METSIIKTVYDPFVVFDGAKSMKEKQAALKDLQKNHPEELAVKMHDALNAVNDILRTKSIQSVGSFPMQTTSSFMSYANELQIDDSWSQFFRFTNGMLGSESWDWDNIVTVKEYDFGAKIEPSPMNGSTRSSLMPKRFGTMVNYLTYLLQANDLIGMNEIMTAMKFAFLKKKTDFAYTILGDTSGVTAATNAATASAEDVAIGINNAITTLITANAGNDFNLSANTGVILLSNFANRMYWNRALRRTEGIDSPHIIIESPIRPVYTFNTNVPALVGGKVHCFLYIPGMKNEWRMFRATEQQIIDDFRSHSMEIVGQEYYNAKRNATQAISLKIT